MSGKAVRRYGGTAVRRYGGKAAGWRGGRTPHGVDAGGGRRTQNDLESLRLLRLRLAMTPCGGATSLPPYRLTALPPYGPTATAVRPYRLTAHPWRLHGGTTLVHPRVGDQLSQMLVQVEQRQRDGASHIGLRPEER